LPRLIRVESGEEGVAFFDLPRVVRPEEAGKDREPSESSQEKNSSAFFDLPRFEDFLQKIFSSSGF